METFDESVAAAPNVDQDVTSVAMPMPLAPLEIERAAPQWDDCLAGIAQGDAEALARLYDGTSQLVYSLAVRILGNQSDAEEVTMDVYTQVWRNCRNFDARRGSVTAWLVMLARSRAIDRLRSRAGHRQREEPLDGVPEVSAPTLSPEQVAALGQQRRLVRAALARLSPEQREAIELAFFSGLSHAEVAARTGQPLGTVKTRIRLAMMRLRELLGAEA
jgi:RNA polymerase sigma-70 factor (ECF subfamily)